MEVIPGMAPVIPSLNTIFPPAMMRDSSTVAAKPSGASAVAKTRKAAVPSIAGPTAGGHSGSRFRLVLTWGHQHPDARHIALRAHARPLSSRAIIVKRRLRTIPGRVTAWLATQ